MYQQNNFGQQPNMYPQQQPMQPQAQQTYPNNNQMQQPQNYAPMPQQQPIPQTGIDENAWFETEGMVTESGAILDKNTGMPKQGQNDKGLWMMWKIKLQTNEGVKTMSTFRKADPQGQWLPVPMTGNYIKAVYKCKENPEHRGNLARSFKSLMKFEILNQNAGMGQQVLTNPNNNNAQPQLNSSPVPASVPTVDPQRIKQFVLNYVEHCTKNNRAFNEYELIGVYFNNKLSEDVTVQELKKVYGEVCGRR